MENFITKYKYYIAFGIFLIHYFFKTYALGVNGLWFDECYSVNMSSNGISEILKSTQTTDPNPPLYLIILHYWMKIFGDSEYGIRLLSVVSSSLASSALFLLCLRFFNWQTSVFASIMFFTSNEIYYYSQEARAFSLVILFVILSNYLYLNIIKSPKLSQAILLGICNVIVFYLHIIAVFNMVAQIICLPVMLIALQKTTDPTHENFSFNVNVSRKRLRYFIVSCIVFIILLLPWAGRILNIMGNEAKTWWVGVASFEDFKYCVFELFNTKELFQVYSISFLAMGLLLFFKKTRQDGFEIRKLLFAIIVGPALICLIYYIALSTPIFVKRYVLFAFTGVIIAYGYVSSMIKINFRSKLVLFVLLGFYSFKGVTYPRASYFEYQKAMVFLKQVNKPNTFIANDMQDLFAYYYDRQIFHVRPDSAKRDSLLARNIYTFTTVDWPDKVDLSKYDHIYYTTSFSMWDAGNTIYNALLRNYILTNDIRIYKGIIIYHYINQRFNEDKGFNNPNVIIYDKKPFHLLAANNKYLVSDGAHGNSLVATSDNKYEWETFRMVKLGQSKIGIATYQGKHFSTELNSKCEITGVRDWVGEWETYTIYDLGKGYVALKACNGKYLSLDEKSKQLFAKAAIIGRNEKFKLVNAGI